MMGSFVVCGRVDCADRRSDGASRRRRHGRQRRLEAAWPAAAPASQLLTLQQDSSLYGQREAASRGEDIAVGSARTARWPAMAAAPATRLDNMSAASSRSKLCDYDDLLTLVVDIAADRRRVGQSSSYKDGQHDDSQRSVNTNKKRRNCSSSEATPAPSCSLRPSNERLVAGVRRSATLRRRRHIASQVPLAALLGCLLGLCAAPTTLAGPARPEEAARSMAPIAEEARAGGHWSLPNRPSLFSIVRFPNEECFDSSNQSGTCYTAFECKLLGGQPSSPCAAGFGSCCIVSRTCHVTTREKVVYFKNPSYPSTDSDEKVCDLTVEMSDINVCQVRLDFLDFQLDAPTNGACQQDYMEISASGMPPQTVPRLCGLNRNQHRKYSLRSLISASSSIHPSVRRQQQRRQLREAAVARRRACESGADAGWLADWRRAGDARCEARRGAARARAHAQQLDASGVGRSAAGGPRRAAQT